MTPIWSEFDGRLSFSSPLEAHKTNTIIHHIVSVEVSLHATFAALETGYTESDQDTACKAFIVVEKVHVTYIRLCRCLDPKNRFATT